MLGGLQRMSALNVLLLRMILDMPLNGDLISTAELWTPAALESDVLFVIKFFAIHQNMGPAQWGNSSWQKLIFQSYTN